MVKPSLPRHGQRFSFFIQALFFSLLCKLVTYIVVKPLMGIILQLTLNISGHKLAFNATLWQFLLSPFGVVCALLLVLVAALFVFYEFSVVILMAYGAARGEPFPLGYAMRLALTTFGCLKRTSFIGFAIYSLGLLPLVNIGVTSSLLPELQIPNFITGELAKSTWSAILLLIAVLVLFLLYFLSLFVLPCMVLHGRSFWRAVADSFRLLRGAKLGVLLVYGAYLAAWLLLFLAPRALFSALLGNPNAGLGDIFSLYGFSFATLCLALVLLAAGLAQLVLMPLLLLLVVSFYKNLGEEVTLREDRLGHVDARLEKLGSWLHKWLARLARLLKKLAAWFKATSLYQKHKKLLAFFAAVLVLFGTASLFNRALPPHAPLVIGHRGSAYGVENTIEALEGAISAGVGLAEVDILLSADGIPMVIHDDSLKRLTGQNLNVHDLTAKELGALTLSQNGHTGRISTLAEVVSAVRGRIDLVVEIKTHGHETLDVIEETLAVLREQEYLGHCRFLSLDYAVLQQIEASEPGAITGYCVYINAGRLDTRVLTSLTIDFIVIEESMVSKATIEAFHKAGIPVYVWTVNDEASIRKYLALGAIGIVSDYPDVAQEALSVHMDTTKIIYLDPEEYNEQEPEYQDDDYPFEEEGL